MTAAQKTVITYAARITDVLSNGTGRPAALVIVTEGDQRVIVRLDRQSLRRLYARIDATLAPERSPALG
jgi:hypothetical protein